MILSSVRRKYIVHPLTIRKKYQTFEIRLPNYVKAVTAVNIHAFEVDPKAARIGTASFQASTVSDVFLSVSIHGDSSALSDDAQFIIKKGRYDESLPYISGRIQKKIPLRIEGDSTIITGWYKDYYTGYPYTVRIILEYEEVEVVVKVS